MLWLASILVYGLGGVWTSHAWGWSGVWAVAPIAAGALLALVSALMAYGLWSLAPWARVLQIVLAAVGLFTLVAGPQTIATVVDHLGTVMPSQATQLLHDSLTRLDHRPSTSSSRLSRTTSSRLPPTCGAACAIGTRACSIVSRSRTVTARSSTDSKSTVTQSGVPTSSWRR